MDQYISMHHSQHPLSLDYRRARLRPIFQRGAAVYLYQLLIAPIAPAARMKSLPAPLVVAIGAAAGGALRQLLLSTAIPSARRLPPSLASRTPFLAPHWRVAAINAVGSAALVRARRASPPLRPHTALLVGAGVCGGFTTFSTFAVEAARLASERGALFAGGYVVVANVAALVAVLAAGGV